MSEDKRLREIRVAILASGKTRASAESVVQAMLDEVAGLDDDDVAPEWARHAVLHDLTVGDLRQRLRVMLEEIAAADE